MDKTLNAYKICTYNYNFKFCEGKWDTVMSRIYNMVFMNDSPDILVFLCCELSPICFIKVDFSKPKTRVALF